MSIFLFVVAVLLVLGYLNSRLSMIRSSTQEEVEKAVDRVRALEGRIAQLERANADRITHEPAQTAPRSETAPAPAATTQAPSRLTTYIAPPTAPAAIPVAPNFTPAPAPPPPVIPAQLPPAPPVSTAAYQQRAVVPVPAVPVAPPPPPVEPATPPAPEPRHISLEERLGERWLNKLGIAFVVIGLASFLAIHLKTMGPWGKVGTGIAVSLAFLLGGLWLERKNTYRILARAGIGGGWALLFFTTFAMHHFDAARVIPSLVVDLVLMLLVAAGMVAHSLRYKSQTVTGLAFLLGFTTLATSAIESADGTAIFTLVASAVLALGLVVVTTLRHWALLEFAGLIAVLANHFLWLSLVLTLLGGKAGFPLFWESTALILFYWLIFRAAYLLRVPVDIEEDRVSSLSAVLLSGGMLGLLKYQSAHPEWAFRALLALGIVEMLLAIWVRRRRHSAFIVLSTVSTVLLVAAVPFRFHGVSWPVLWLVEAHVLALCGLRLGEPIFRRLGLIAGFCAAFVLAAKDVVDLASFRLSNPDPSHHWSLTVGLALAALLFWLHAEFYPRRWPAIAAEFGDLERAALLATSWMGVAAAATALWVVLPSAWVAVGWLALVVAFGLVADRNAILNFALQADLLAVVSIPALVYWDLFGGTEHHQKIASGIAIALLYLGTRRRTVPSSFAPYVFPAYSWLASMLLVFWIGDFLPDDWLPLAWALLALALYELGRRFAKASLRWQGFVPVFIAFADVQGTWIGRPFHDQPHHGWFAITLWDWISLLAAVTLAYWLQERIRQQSSAALASPLVSGPERAVGIGIGAIGTAIIACWLPNMVPAGGPNESASTAWAALACALLAVALAARRPAFQVHAIGVCLWTGIFGVMIVFGGAINDDAPWWYGNLFTISVGCAVLLASLAFAFPLRARYQGDERMASWPELFKRPEQWFFFVPFALMIVTLAARLNENHITLGWSVLGLGAFIFALIVGERSFRLGGLALLLLAVAKILLMDIWRQSLSDRYITLIVMGCALLLVSFLYTRFRDIFRKLL